ncbi:MAG: acyl carrier protein [Candidatus Tagabacteria bacterium]
METTDIFKKAKEIVVNQLDVKENQVVAEAKFVDDLGADSLDTMEMIMAFEDQYKIEISDEDAEGLLTVKDVVDYIQRRLKQKGENDRLYPTYSI